MVFAAKKNKEKETKTTNCLIFKLGKNASFNKIKKTLLKRFLRSHHVTVKGHGLISDSKNYQTSKILLAFVSIKQP